MELTHATVDDLPARLGPGKGPVRLPDDLDPQAATALLADRYGAPSTLLLAGTSTRTGSCTAGNPVRVRRRPVGYDSSVMLVAMPSVIFTVADREPAFAAFSSCASVHSTAA
ncbi:hypothetical protein JHN52_07145 [Streptomyces sp. MBT97]|uniref:hypothetical protein n=1 Tax=Streptomyces sp. MBT97 TaxID=2800411 RepID=UPI00190BA1A8|nr:hypothetical protein [Streptomyces sp. MBT97]MBK3632738.1 hypothetical protein [Streptomyces sp. MBT97]